MHPPIIKDFADYIDPLNAKATPFKNVQTVAGYCYRWIDGTPSIKPAHGLPVGEGQEHHRRGMDFVIRHAPNSIRETSGPVYMGAAGVINLGYIAKSRARAAILFDINPTLTPYKWILEFDLRIFRKKAGDGWFPINISTKFANIIS